MLENKARPLSEPIQETSAKIPEPEREAKTDFPWPPPPRPRARQGIPVPLKVLTLTLALLLILGGMSFIIYAATTQYGLAVGASRNWNSQATVRSQATLVSSLAQTAQPLATSQAQIEATATAEVLATATAQSTGDQALATATTMENLLTQKTSKTPDLDDALLDNSENNQWDVGHTDNNATGCDFATNGYEAQEARLGFLQPCFADTTSFHNFVYKISMTIDKGSQGGMIFRGDSNKNKYYLFRIDINGAFALDLYNGNKYTPLLSGTSTAILPGNGLSNDLAVIAVNDSLTLFLNGAYVGSVSDKALSTGQIGVAAINADLPTTVNFTGAQVWKLA